jgi:hypothetical protein
MARERNQRIIKGGTSGSGIGIGWPAGILPPGLPGLGTGVGGLGSSYDSGRVSERVAASVLDRLQPIEKLAKWFYLGLAVLIVVFATSVAANNGRQAWQAAGDFVLAVGCSFLIASGAAAVGCLLGFLFGIPRSRHGLHLVLIQAPPSGSGEGKMHSDEEGTPQLEQKKPTEPGRISADHGAEDCGDSPFLINTSQEEISDWLTKIIIGLGLVQFSDPHYVSERCSDV